MKLKVLLCNMLMSIAALLFVSSVMAAHAVDRDGTMVTDEAEIDKLAEEVGIEHGALDLMKKYHITEEKLRELLKIDSEEPRHSEEEHQHPEEPAKEIVQLDKPAEPAETAEPKKSRLKIGGAIRANYVYGDYHQRPTYFDTGPDNTGDRRGRNVGGFMFDTFRINVDLDSGGSDGLIGKLEHRWWWYLKNPGYSALSKAWLGYTSEKSGTFKAGIVRVPFGPGPYGISSSWFFDQHYYVGLSDDRDLGLTWTNTFGNLTLDLGYFLQSEGHWEGGASRDSVRYSYDPVKWDIIVDPQTGDAQYLGWTDGETCDCGFQEEHQFNLRAIYATDSLGEFGASFQYGMLKGTNVGADDDGAHYALSAHAKNQLSDFTLVSQISYYKFDIPDDTPWGTGDLIPLGAYDFAWLTASEGWIPAINLRYIGIDTSQIWPDWLWLHSLKPDSITPYIEWSSIQKTGKDLKGNNFKPSSLWVIGASFSRGGWYNYIDWAISDGNLFVGNDFGTGNYGNIYDTGGTFGANMRGEWNQRFNINFGYYF
ncbi:MAG: hypothetical protein OXF47_04165 [Nitrospira sp.]|nr:hypothetical protein [Nitrospira sp.]